MKSKIVFDTNILIYALDADSVHHAFAVKIFKSFKNCYITSKTVSEFVAVLSKMGLYNVIEIELERLNSIFTILTPNENSLKIFKDLVLKYRPKGNRVYDFEIVSVMLAYDIKKIATINTDDFKSIKEIEIITS